MENSKARSAREMKQSEVFSVKDVKLGTPCPPLKLKPEPTCDIMRLTYRLNVVEEKIPVEVVLHYEMERCSLDYVLGDLLYSTTLLPQERVWLSFRNRHSVSRLTDDKSFSAHTHAYNSVSLWMDTYRTLATDYDRTYGETAVGSSHSTGSSKDEGGFSFFGLFGSADVKSTDAHDAYSVSSYANELHEHLRSTYHQTNYVSRVAESTTITEVSSHREVEQEINDEVKVGVRVFKNPNYCHTLNFLFYQIARRQKVRIELKGISYRAIIPDAETSVRMKDYKLSLAENPEILKMDDRVKLAEKGVKFATFAQPSTSLVASMPYRRISTPAVETVAYRLSDVQIYNKLKDYKMAFPEDDRKDAVENVNRKIKEMELEFKMESESLIPTNAVYVDSTMGSCNGCEPYVIEKQKLDLENLKLKNLMLSKQIELLEKHQDYRCCPNNEENDQ